MSRVGNVWDNSAMESFFSSLKTERTNRKVYRTRDEARAVVVQIEGASYRLRHHADLIPEHTRSHATITPPPPPKRRG